MLRLVWIMLCCLAYQSNSLASVDLDQISRCAFFVESDSGPVNLPVRVPPRGLGELIRIVEQSDLDPTLKIRLVGTLLVRSKLSPPANWAMRYFAADIKHDLVPLILTLNEVSLSREKKNEVASEFMEVFAAWEVIPWTTAHNYAEREEKFERLGILRSRWCTYLSNLRESSLEFTDKFNELGGKNTAYTTLAQDDLK